MLEEAAGVRMYECKKQNAIRIIEKRDAKVEEISRVFDMTDFFLTFLKFSYLMKTYSPVLSD